MFQNFFLLVAIVQIPKLTEYHHQQKLVKTHPATHTCFVQSSTPFWEHPSSFFRFFASLKVFEFWSLKLFQACMQGVLHVHWVILGTSNTPPISWTKIIQFMGFIEYPHEGIAFLLGFNLLFFGLNVRLESNFW
jgi:hypothetical protein